jgi:hypothetical protein
MHMVKEEPKQDQRARHSQQPREKIFHIFSSATLEKSHRALRQVDCQMPQAQDLTPTELVTMVTNDPYRPSYLRLRGYSFSWLNEPRYKADPPARLEACLLFALASPSRSIAALLSLRQDVAPLYASFHSQRFHNARFSVRPQSTPGQK